MPRLSSKSQIVIPAEMRRKLGIQPGDPLNVALEGERIVITKQSPEEALSRMERFVGDPEWEGASKRLKQGREDWADYSRDIERARVECRNR
jgi:antitoxin PrlF